MLKIFLVTWTNGSRLPTHWSTPYTSPSTCLSKRFFLKNNVESKVPLIYARYSVDAKLVILLQAQDGSNSLFRWQNTVFSNREKLNSCWNFISWSVGSPSPYQKNMRNTLKCKENFGNTGICTVHHEYTWIVQFKAAISAEPIPSVAA
jgi:hypothetical protein